MDTLTYGLGFAVYMRVLFSVSTEWVYLFKEALRGGGGGQTFLEPSSVLS